MEVVLFQFAVPCGVWKKEIVENENIQEHYDMKGIGSGCIFGCGSVI